MSMMAVVVWDPSGRLPDGSILEDNQIAVARGEGVVALPLQKELLRRGGAAGWSKRSYGRGWQYDATVSGPGCPLLLQVAAGYPLIHWTARLAPHEPGAPIAGSLRLSGDTTQIGAGAFGLSLEDGPVQINRLGDADEAGGLIISGKCRIRVASDVAFGLQLYGYLSGARVLWLAASQGA